MKLAKKLLHRLSGLAFPQEYLCFASESFQQPLYVSLLHPDGTVEDIRFRHAFVGYSPLVFAIFSTDPGASSFPEKIDIVFSALPLQPIEGMRPADALARLSMKKIKEIKAGVVAIAFFEGESARHRFLSPFRQLVIDLHNRLFQRKPGNVFLPGNQYKQVQVAYSLPRNISLITVGIDGLFNLFPTDLHGPVGDQYYLLSLRHEGKAFQQVESSRRIALSRVHCEAYKTVYGLGKNHMKEPGPANGFPFGTKQSGQFSLPLPSNALSTRELEWVESFEHGIHRIMLFRVVSEERFSDQPATLSHIHNVYATWRHNNGLPGNYLLR